MPKLEDFTGRVCGCWQVIERDRNPKSKSHETFWKCKCQRCGNLASVRKTDLKKEPKSCNNCNGYELRSYKIGDQYGLLTIIDKAPTQGSGHTYMKCKCECGNLIKVRLDYLKGQYHDKTISCGCASISSGKLKIKRILEENKINFRYQYVIPELSKFMSFDFAIMDNSNNLVKLIEFDDEQHFYPVEIFGGEKTFKLQQERDKKKDAYCRENGISLLRIPYTDYDKISIDLLLS